MHVCVCVFKCMSVLSLCPACIPFVLSQYYLSFYLKKVFLDCMVTMQSHNTVLGEFICKR